MRRFGTLDEIAIDSLIRLAKNKIEKLPEIVNKYIQERLEAAYQQEEAARLMQEAANSGFTINEILFCIAAVSVVGLLGVLLFKQGVELNKLNADFQEYKRVSTKAVNATFRRVNGTRKSFKDFHEELDSLTEATLHNTKSIASANGLLDRL